MAGVIMLAPRLLILISLPRTITCNQFLHGGNAPTRDYTQRTHGDSDGLKDLHERRRLEEVWGTFRSQYKAQPATKCIGRRANSIAHRFPELNGRHSHALPLRGTSIPRTFRARVLPSLLPSSARPVPVERLAETPRIQLDKHTVQLR